jgi:hypothetical protein
MDNDKLIDALQVELRAGFHSVTEKIGETNARLDDVNTRLDGFSDRVDKGFAGLGNYLIELEKHHDKRISRLERRKNID